MWVCSGRAHICCSYTIRKRYPAGACVFGERCGWGGARLSGLGRPASNLRARLGRDAQARYACKSVSQKHAATPRPLNKYLAKVEKWWW